MIPDYRSILTLLVTLALACNNSQAAGSTEILATVDNLQITASDLEQAVRSSPFATQFNTLDEDEQASLRGGLLQRMVVSRLLLLEAEAQNLEDTNQYRNDLERFRIGLLHRRYMDRLRERIRIPDEINARMKEQFKGNHDAYTAARAAYIADEYRQARIQEIRRLREHYHVQLYEERILPAADPQTILLQGDGMRVLYSDLLALKEYSNQPTLTPKWIQHQLYLRAELMLTSRAAIDAGIDITDDLAAFRNERLPALLVENLGREWLPDEAPLIAYYDSYPELGRILERRHIGQLVLTTREEATNMRKRILAGESLFALAGKYSIDPYGRKNNGDMGWIKEDRGNPVINTAIANLKDGEVSEVIQTPLGFHLVTILERKPGEARPYSLIKDKVRQMYLSEKMTVYTQGLEQKYKVVWQVIGQKPKQMQ